MRSQPEPMVVLPERAIELNTTGQELLGLCDGVRTTGGVAAALRASHREPESVERDAYAFLEEMERIGVLELAA